MTSYLKLDFEAAAERRRGRLQAVSRAIATIQLVKWSILGELKGSCKAKSHNSMTKAFFFGSSVQRHVCKVHIRFVPAALGVDPRDLRNLTNTVFRYRRKMSRLQNSPLVLILAAISELEHNFNRSSRNITKSSSVFFPLRMQNSLSRILSAWLPWFQYYTVQNTLREISSCLYNFRMDFCIFSDPMISFVGNMAFEHPVPVPHYVD